MGWRLWSCNKIDDKEQNVLHGKGIYKVRNVFKCYFDNSTNLIKKFLKECLQKPVANLASLSMALYSEEERANSTIWAVKWFI